MSGVYRLTDTLSIIRIEDLAYIPCDLQNTDYQKYLRWREELDEEGNPNVPDPKEVPTVLVPDQGTIPPILIASALNISIENSNIKSVDGIFGLAGAVYLGTGMYMMFFMTSQPDTSYYAILNGGAPVMSVIEKDIDYFIVHASNTADGDAVDALSFSVQIYRGN